MANKALIIVDVQNDFCPGGALPVPDGDKVVEPLNDLIEHAFENNWLIVATRDWHPRNTKHFAEFGGQWPAHCVQNTFGAEFHPHLATYPLDINIFSKGTGNNEDAYSGFEGRRLFDMCLLGEYLKSFQIKEVYVCGLATDYCVKATALDAVKKGFKTYLILDACRAVDVHPGDGDGAVEEMRGAGVVITTSEEVLNERR